VRTREGAHGGEGGCILMDKFESASACGEIAPVRVQRELRRHLGGETCRRIEIVPVWA
jgi:hypothetical protein